MSDTTSDTSAIDDKKKENSSGGSTPTFASNIIGFITSFISLILVVLLYFSGSSLLLFVCKLAQSNILPTEDNCFPYTEHEPTIQSVKTNIFTTTFTDPEMSMKLEFPYDNYNASNKILDMFRKYKNKPSSHFLANYFISIVEHLLSFNFSTINTTMNALNGLPEPLLIALGPIIVGFLFAVMLILNLFYTIYVWFANMSWFFKTNTNDSGDGLPRWKDVTIANPMDWGLGIGLVILFSLLFLVGFGVVSCIPFVILFYCYVTCIMYKGIMDGKKVTSLTIIKENLKYYKVPIVSIISLFVVLLAFSKLGVVPGVFAVLTVGLIYWGVISIDVFKPIPEQNLTPSVSYEQANKKCSIAKASEKHGFLYNLLIGQKGGNITKELKKLGKQLAK